MRKLESPLKSTQKKIKIRMEKFDWKHRLKKSTKPGQNDKTKERRWNMDEQKRKVNTRKITIQLEEINQKVQAKKLRLKRYRKGVKLYRQNRAFHKNERKLYQQVGGYDTKTYQQLLLYAHLLHHNDTKIKTDTGSDKDAGRPLYKYIYLSLYCKGSKRLCGVLLWEGGGDRT